MRGCNFESCGWILKYRKARLGPVHQYWAELLRRDSGSRKTLAPMANSELLRKSERSRFMRSKAAADYLGVSEWTLRKLAHDGEIRYIQRTPRSPMLFDISDLDLWVERNKQDREG